MHNYNIRYLANLNFQVGLKGSKFKWPGIGSAQSGYDVNNEIGGVVYMYNESHVVVKVPTSSKYKHMYAIFTGKPLNANTDGQTVVYDKTENSNIYN